MAAAVVPVLPMPFRLNPLLLATAQARVLAIAEATKHAQGKFDDLLQILSAGQPGGVDSVGDASSVADFLLLVRVVQAQVTTLEETLQQSAPNTAAAVNNALNAALAKLYQLAVFVRGQYL